MVEWHTSIKALELETTGQCITGIIKSRKEKGGHETSRHVNNLERLRFEPTHVIIVKVQLKGKAYQDYPNKRQGLSECIKNSGVI